jgi:hypothetical protein
MTSDPASRRAIAHRQRLILTAALAVLSLALSTTGATAASQGMVTFTSSSSSCSAAWSHLTRGVLNIEDPLPIAPPPVGPPLFNRYDWAGDGPQCPARASSATEQAAAAASSGLDGQWSVDLEANTTAGIAFAGSTVDLSSTIDNDTPGDLFVAFDRVAQSYDTSCTGCGDPPQAGYILTITVRSGAGEVSISCGSGGAPEQERSFTLPDDRCALAADGGPARLPVSAGKVTIDIEVMAFARVAGGAQSAVKSHAATRATAHVGSVYVDTACGASAPC